MRRVEWEAIVRKRSARAGSPVLGVAGDRLGRSEACVVLASRRLDEAGKRRSGAYAGSGGGLGGAALPTIRTMARSRWQSEQVREPWCSCSASMGGCICFRCRRRCPPICEKRCIHRGPRMIRGMRTCCWICCCSIATSCAVCRPIRKPRVGCKIWWRNGASWWTRKQSKLIGLPST